MKTHVLAFLAAGISSSIAHAQNTMPEFSRPSLKVPPLSLLAATDQIIQGRLKEVLTPTSGVSKMAPLHSPAAIGPADESIEPRIAGKIRAIGKNPSTSAPGAHDLFPVTTDLIAPDTVREKVIQDFRSHLESGAKPN